jgi:hypothetical protein
MSASGSKEERKEILRRHIAFLKEKTIFLEQEAMSLQGQIAGIEGQIRGLQMMLRPYEAELRKLEEEPRETSDFPAGVPTFEERRILWAEMWWSSTPGPARSPIFLWPLYANVVP